jgi:hypothetical protein
LQRTNINWELFLFILSCKVIPEVDKLTSEFRKSVLIIDDSTYYRDRSKKVEFLSRCYDHVANKFYKGLTLLTLGWSDGQTFIPINFRLLGSGTDKNLLEGSHVKEDKRTLASKRRSDALKDKPSLVLSMLKSVKGSSAQAKYVLFDSWFSSPNSIISVKKLGYHVVSRLKNNNNFLYNYKGDNLPISKIYNSNRKRRGKSRYLLSIEVEVRHKDFSDVVPAKIVYVRDKSNAKKWIALISTDISLSENEIIALYGKRWDIEPFHKIIKSCLRLENEFQMRSYDAMTAHATIVMTRYIFLSLENRENKDLRSINEGFFTLCKELEDTSFSYVFELIISLFKQHCSEYFDLDKIIIDSFVELFISKLPDFLRNKLTFSTCES